MRRQLMREQETLLGELRYASTPGGRAAAMLGLPPSAPATPTTAGSRDDRRFGELERATAQLTGQGMDTHATALSELLADIGLWTKEHARAKRMIERKGSYGCR